MPRTAELPALFARNRLVLEDVDNCLELLRERYPGHRIRELGCQGGCSWTLVVQRADSCISQPVQSVQDDRLIVQFRSIRHALDMEIAGYAKHWYGHLVPDVAELGQTRLSKDVDLMLYQMSYITGTRFSDVQSHDRHLDRNRLSRYDTLFESLADFYAMAWETGTKHGSIGKLMPCDGKVGSTILERLLKLERKLPSDDLRATARRCRLAYQNGVLDSLPMVLVHGDLLPSNIMIDEKTWDINGFVDWAEAECLPFGMCFYALDHLLGYLEDVPSTCKPRFVYYEQAAALRCHFWELLAERIPDLHDSGVKEAVGLARDIGVLLWHGIAFDDGKVDRVVENGTDAVEVAYLTAFQGSCKA